MDDVIDVEVVDEPTVAALTPARVEPSTALVTPAASTDAIKQAFHAYTELCDSLLQPSDYQRIGKKDFRKKSAWRKLAVAFGVTCEIIDRQYERDGRHIVRAEVVVRATAPNGRSMDGLGACDLFEKCCPPDCRRKRYNDHTCCAADCPGSVHFSNPQHDIPATAATRATNRACADLFGMGEVSAEEITDRHEPGEDTPPPRDDARTARLKELNRLLTPDQKTAYKAWLKEKGMGDNRTAEQIDACVSYLEALTKAAA